MIDQAHHQLGCNPLWDFATTVVVRTVAWYGQVQEGQASAPAYCLNDLAAHLG